MHGSSVFPVVATRRYRVNSPKPYKRYDKSFAAKVRATYTAMDYNMNMRLAPHTDAPLDIISQGAGYTSLFQLK